RAPMTSVVMIFETTRDYAVIVPLMISNLVSFFISSRLQEKPIYEVLAEQDGIHLPGAESRSQDGQRRVFRVLRAPTESLQVTQTAREALTAIASSEHRAWPVMQDQRLAGMISMEVLQKAAAENGTGRPLSELVDSADFPHLHVDHTLAVAL